MWKATVSFVVSVHLLVCLSAWNNSAPAGWIFMKFGIWVFFGKYVKKIYFIWIWQGWRVLYTQDWYTFLIVSCSVLLRMRNVSDKRCRENQNTHFVVNNFFFPFLKLFRLWDSVEKYCRTTQVTDDSIIGRRRIAQWLPKAANTYSEYVLLIALPLHQLLDECASWYFTHMACLVIIVFLLCCATERNVSKFLMCMSYRSFGLKIQLTVTHDVITVWTAMCYVYHVT